MLRRLNENIDCLYIKRNFQEVKNQQIDHRIVKKYLNKELATKDKVRLTEEIGILDTRGENIKWPTLKKNLLNSDYEVEDKVIRIGDKTKRVSIITLIKDLKDK